MIIAARRTDRVIAYLLDSIFLGIILAIITVPIYLLIFNKEQAISEEYLNSINEITLFNLMSTNKDLMIFIILFFITSFIISFLYNILYPYKNDGQTFGRKIMKIKIIKNDGTKVSLGRLLFREFIVIYIMSNVLQGIIFFISILFTLRENKMALHDMISGTMVVEKEDNIIE